MGSLRPEEVSKCLNRIFGRVPARAESGKEMLTIAGWTPCVDMCEPGKAYQVKAEIHGVKKGDVNVPIKAKPAQVNVSVS